MEPSIEVGDRILVDKTAYGLRVPFTNAYVVDFGRPTTGDVVIVDNGEPGPVLVKRLIAGPGDTVAVRGGRLWINGAGVEVTTDPGGTSAVERLADRSHPIRLTHGGGLDYGPAELGEDEYLVLGDNRGQSRDGRFFGPVSRSALLGRVLGVYRRNGEFVWRGL